MNEIEAKRKELKDIIKKSKSIGLTVLEDIQIDSIDEMIEEIKQSLEVKE